MNDTTDFQREIGRIISGGYYDYQNVRVGAMNRLRAIIRRKNEDLSPKTPETKKENKTYSKDYTDNKIALLLNQMNAEGKIAPSEYEYIEKLQKLFAASKKMEGEWKNVMGEYVSTEPLWTQWLCGIRGISTVLTANLLREFGYCDSTYLENITDEAGNILHKQGDPRCPHISSLWKVCGLHVVNGEAPKKKRGQKLDFNPKLRTLLWKIGDSFVKQRTPYYRDIYDIEKARQLHLMEQEAPNAPKSKLHADQRARRKAEKLFLAHYYYVARNIKNLPVSEPYPQAKLGHTHIDMPTYNKEKRIWETPKSTTK